MYQLEEETNTFVLMKGSPSTPVRGDVSVDGSLFITSDIAIHKYIHYYNNTY